MDQRMATKRAPRFCSLLVLIGLVGALVPAAVQALPVQLEASALLQFTAGGHVLGFAPEVAYLATGSHALRVGFVGAKAVQPQGVGREGASSGGAQPLGRVTYADLWEGITLTYEAVEGGATGAVAKSTYHLAPGADVSQIRLAYNVPVAVQADGSLRLSFATGEMRESAPLAWQEIEGRQVPVPVAFVVRGQTVAFRLGDYDPCYPLTIDPSYAWHSFYGGSDNDYGYGIAVDGSGGVYVAGWSYAAWQGNGGVDPLHPHSGEGDISVLKLDSSGAYQWHTFYGSSTEDAAWDIAVDSSGGVYVAGYSSATWQGDGGTDPLHPHSGSPDITVLKLDSAGAYQWHTFYGSGADDYPGAIAMDGIGGVYVVGRSGVTWQGDGDTDPLHPHSGYIDIIVLKLDSAGAYQWHTFYGSSLWEIVWGIALDGSGGVCVAGFSGATWQGDGGAEPLHAHAGNDDIFVLKLDGAGAYQWHTFYGSGACDIGLDIVVGGSDSVYVAGFSCATWQGDGGANPLHPFNGYQDITVLKLDSAGSYQWHTFYGSSDRDHGWAIARDGSGGLYLTGRSFASWQGDGGANPLHPYNGPYDITVLKLDDAGAYQWHIFYGSNESDFGSAIVVDGSDDVYVTGYSWATWQGDGGAGPAHPHSGYYDITVLKLVRGYKVYLPLIVRNQ